jgi:beta-glucosidase/6-phospho-beta-glucosidase/beta-galactosidase
MGVDRSRCRAAPARRRSVIARGATVPARVPLGNRHLGLWEIYPQGLREVLTWANTLGVPLFVTENGIADGTDTKRAQYLFDHLSTLQAVIQEGAADVRGYFEWSLTDNFEWSSGYYPKFGLYAYDPATGKRMRRPSAKLYRAIARHRGLTASLLRRYGS